MFVVYIEQVTSCFVHIFYLVNIERLYPDVTDCPSSLWLCKVQINATGADKGTSPDVQAV